MLSEKTLSETINITNKKGQKNIKKGQYSAKFMSRITNSGSILHFDTIF